MNRVLFVGYLLLCGFPIYVSNFYIDKKKDFIKRAAEKKKDIFKRNVFHLFIKKEENEFFENKNLIRIEFRPGVGGEEALSWSRDLLKVMRKEEIFTYKTFAEKYNCTVKKVQDISESLVVSSNDNININKCGKEINISLFDLFKNEGGVHQAKIHSSTATIAIFLHKHNESKNKINSKDMKVTTFRSSKPGGQNVNKIESGVRILHKPTGIQSECQEERTQELNKRIAMKRLILKIQEQKIKDSINLLQNERSKLVKESNRSNRIRTYNFFRGYITDHVTKRKLELMYFERARLEYLLNI
ncbi:peptide chain release factor 1 [Plasmodium brasilianum]|uniref:Peptide chain release factor 1 n=1 Tax=Plasmodium brasilianum TaxID=5824 RepID=A0ACB9Y598_PLABR|nr:peptide chain release factor 1 [Plasmodium brasilianum]